VVIEYLFNSIRAGEQQRRKSCRNLMDVETSAKDAWIARKGRHSCSSETNSFDIEFNNIEFIGDSIVLNC
jgi:hypothetical protein